MNFKTIAILLSFGAVCSSAVYGMEPSFEEQRRALQAKSQELAKQNAKDLEHLHAKSKEAAEQRVKCNESTKLLSQKSVNIVSDYDDVQTKINAIMLAVQNGTMSRQDAQRAREEIMQSYRNQAQARLEELKQFAQGK